MIETLRIRGVALIDEAEIVFGDGLNILSGETGAGKSIIIDALKYVLGGRAGKDFVRVGAEAAFVEALFCVEGEKTARELADAGAELDEEGRVLLSRSLTSQGKSVCRINGRTVPAGMLRDAAALLIDIHGQHDSLSLFDSDRHLGILDMFCAREIAAPLKELAGLYAKFRETMKAAKALTISLGDKAAKTEGIRGQIAEIRGAGLTPKEEAALLRKRDELSDASRLYGAATEAAALLGGGGDGETGAERDVVRAAALLKQVAETDTSLAGLAEQFAEAAEKISEAAYMIEKYAANLEDNPALLEKIEKRLDIIYRLKKKYGGSAEDVISRAERLEAELSLLEETDERLRLVNIEKKKSAASLMKLSTELSGVRADAALRLQNEIEGVLRDLGMKNARFSIRMERGKEFSAIGFDRAEFMISTNPGEEPRPLAKIASGGEVSRVMLAIKAVLADVDQMETFVFDEIDTGVSGRAAQKVGEKLKLVAKKHRIICVTHLPQIAAMADTHFLIEKKTDSGTGRTTTRVKRLDADETVMELARLIGGAKITEATERAAAELKKFGSGAAADDRSQNDKI